MTHRLKKSTTSRSTSAQRLRSSRPALSAQSYRSPYAWQSYLNQRRRRTAVLLGLGDGLASVLGLTVIFRRSRSVRRACRRAQRPRHAAAQPTCAIPMPHGHNRLTGGATLLANSSLQPARCVASPMAESDEVTLTDGVVLLRRWRTADAPAVFAACQDPLIAHFIPDIPRPYTEEDARTFVAIRGRDWDGEQERSFAITDASTGDLLGAIARHGPFGHRYSFGYWLAPQARGQGHATRALRLITDWTLATTDAIRLELYTDPENDASGRVAERAGYEREGIRRAWDINRDGRPMDVVFYVRVRDPLAD